MSLRRVAAWLAQLTLVLSQSCYDENGKKVTHGAGASGSKKWRECPGEGVKTCCLDSGDTCFQSGMCWSPDGGSFYRGMCADASWDDSTCPQVCLDLRLSDGDTWINFCPTNWCCAGPSGASYDCCGDNNAETFARPVIHPLVQDASPSASSNPGATSSVSNPSGVDSSTVIALGVGLSVAFLIALVVIAWLVLASKERGSRNKAEPLSSQGYGLGWVGTTAAEHKMHVAEAHSESRSEAYSESRSEAHGNSRRFEVPG